MPKDKAEAQEAVSVKKTKQKPTPVVDAAKEAAIRKAKRLEGVKI